MQSTLTQQRVRRDVEVLCGARLELSVLCCELDASLQRALPHVASVFAVIDPDMRLPTIAYKFGALEGHNASDADVAAWESAPEATHDATSLQALIAGGVRAITVSALGPAGSPRFQHLAPAFGFADELRVVAVGSGRVWGLLALFSDAAEFAADDVTFAASLAPTLGAGVRSGVLRGILNGVPARLRSPGFLTVDPEGRVLARNTAADAWLAEIDDVAPASGWTGMIAALAGRARASCGEATGEAACRVPIRNGGWAVARASVLHPTGEVLVALSEAGPRDIIPLIAEAFGLTPREREVVNLVLRGADTRRMGRPWGCRTTPCRTTCVRCSTRPASTAVASCWASCSSNTAPSTTWSEPPRRSGGRQRRTDSVVIGAWAAGCGPGFRSRCGPPRPWGAATSARCCAGGRRPLPC